MGLNGNGGGGLQRTSQREKQVERTRAGSGRWVSRPHAPIPGSLTSAISHAHAYRPGCRACTPRLDCADANACPRVASTPLPGPPTLGRRLPSTSRKSGGVRSPAAAPSIAFRAACRMLMVSISPASIVLLRGCQEGAQEHGVWHESGTGRQNDSVRVREHGRQLSSAGGDCGMTC